MVLRQSPEVDEFGHTMLDWSLRQERRREDVPQQTPVRRARTTILAAKYAYAQGSRSWLGLFSRAVALVEECPPEQREGLLASLCSLQRAQRGA